MTSKCSIPCITIVIVIILPILLLYINTLIGAKEVIGQTQSNRIIENLGRGVVALRIGTRDVFISWRLLINDPDDIAFNVYRRIGTMLTRVNSEPLRITNTVDRVDDFSKEIEYIVVPVINGIEDWSQATSKPLGKLSINQPIRSYIVIPLKKDAINLQGNIQGARVAGIGDLDGDGEYEIVVKRGDQDLDPSQITIPDHLPRETYKLEAYKLDGTFMWRIDLGPNIRPGIWYSPFVVYDLDGDSKAEVVTIIGENSTFYTRDGSIIHIGDLNGDGRLVYTDELGRQIADPLYFAIIDGYSGKPLVFGQWIPMISWSYWGDNTGNRASRNLMAIAYLDGHLPSLIIARGIYTHIHIEAWNWRNNKLERVWSFQYPFQGISKGFHQIRVADVDDDKKDEIIYGAIAIDDSGKLLWDSGLAHGDRFHLTDIDPSRSGREIFYVQENPGQCSSGCKYVFVSGGKVCNVETGTPMCQTVSGTITLNWRPGIALVESSTGRIIWAYIGAGISDQDIGRGSCGDIDPRYRGIECWASRPTSPGNLFNITGHIIGPSMNLVNFNIWWDGDLLREHLDVIKSNTFTVSKYDWNTKTWKHMLDATNIIPGSRNAPLAIADIIGDWREEFIAINTDKTEIRIYISTTSTNYTLYTLMQDPQYRLDIVAQTSGYMQSPHTSFYLGYNMQLPPPKHQYIFPITRTTTTPTTTPRTTTPTTTTPSPTTTVVTTPTTPSPTITTVTSVVPVTLSTVVSVPVTVSVTFTVTSPISTVVPVTHTTTVPVTIIRTITITQTRTTTITTTTPTTTVVTTTPRTTTSPTTTTPRTTTTPSPTLTTSPTTPRTIITVVADSNNVFPWECLDTDGNGVCEFMLEGNLWNCPGITRGNVQLIAKVYGSKDYQLDVSVDVNYSGTGGWVHGYPEIWVGGKPWNDYGPAPEGFIGERVNLPIKVRDITRGNVDLCVYVESYSITHTDKRVLYNFAFETWLTRDTTRGRGVRDNEVELMVWFSYHGLQGAGDVAEVVPITVYVDQLKVSQRFEIWHGNMGWEYFAFRSTVPRTSGRYLAWCWDDFLVAAGRHTYLSGWEDLYFTVSELGTEFGGVKVPWAYLKWSIKNYWLSKGLYLPVQITGEYQPQEVALGSCSGDVCPVKVNAGRPANLSGYMEFKVGYSGQITTNKGTINVKEGDIVKIEFNSVGGRIVIPRDGWTSMSEVGVSAIYLNNQKVVENAVITGSSFRIDFSSIKSELKAILWGSGWTNVTYNGIAHLEEANSNPIIIPKLTASPNQQLYIGITVSSDSKTTDIEGLSAPPIRVLW